MKKSIPILLFIALLSTVLQAAEYNPAASIIRHNFETMDANDDGMVEKSEFMAFHEEMGAAPSAAGIITGQFGKLDRNDDSMVSMKEFMGHYMPMFSDAAAARIKSQ